MIGNGDYLPITHIGSSTLSANKSMLYLSYLLHVPNATSNLLSVHKLCNENKVSVEFYQIVFV